MNFLELRLVKAILVGILIGISFGLFVSPTSRTLLLALIKPSAAHMKLRSLAMESEGHPLPKPINPAAASLWVRLFEKKIAEGKTILPTEATTIARICQVQGQADMDNGFWNQANALAAWKLGNRKMALHYWQVASNDLEWDTGESAFISQAAQYNDLTAQDAVFVKSLRNAYCEQATHWLAKQILSKYWNDSKLGLTIRLETVKNAALIRRHSRTLAGMDEAIAICDSALLPPNSAIPLGHHELLVARIDLENLAKSNGNPQIASVISNDFEENDSALALASRQDSTDVFKNFAAEAALIDTLPGASLASIFIFVGLVAVYSIYGYIQKKTIKSAGIGTLVLCALAGSFGLLFGLSLATLTLVLAIVFAQLTPLKTRSRHSAEFGPLFEFVCFCVAGLYVTSVVWFGMKMSSAFQSSAIAESNNFIQFISLAGAFELLASLLFLIGPLWAFAQRVDSSKVIEKAFLLTSKIVLAISLIGVILATPICVHYDKVLQTPINEISQNEPLYYILK